MEFIFMSFPLFIIGFIGWIIYRIVTMRKEIIRTIKEEKQKGSKLIDKGEVKELFIQFIRHIPSLFR